MTSFAPPAALSSEAKSLDPDFLKKSKFNSKAFGDSLYYQDFAGALPLNWSVVNNSPNNFQWVWNTTYVAGQFSTNVPTIASTTAANGFMVLTADFFNTPIPTTGAVPMDTYFESENINLTSGGLNPGGIPSVWVTYQQAVRYCCNGSNKLELHVSSDNFVTWTEYDATNDIAVNGAFAGTNVINISTSAALETDIKIRFLSSANSHYYWMIDDFAVIEGPENDMELRTPYLEFNFDYAFNPFYGQIPFDLFPPLPLSGEVYNNGSNNLTGVRIEGDIFHTSDTSGLPNTGLGLVYSTSSSLLPLQSGNTRDTADYVVTNSPRFVPPALGEFRVDMIATSDSVDQNLGNEIYSQTFITSDTVFARDDNGYGGGTGPGDYQGGGTANGDKFGTMYIVESRTGNGVHTIPTSITFAVSDDVDNIGVEILPRIWSWDEDSATVDAAFTGLVASSFIPYTVLASDTNTLLTLPLDFGPATTLGMDSGQYVVGWEVTNFQLGTKQFEVFEDASSRPFQDNVTCFMDLANTVAGWTWVPQNPVIRLNMSSLPIPTGLKGVSNSSTEFTIAPNPNKGLFKMTVTSKEVVTYNLNVRNMLGQVVYTDVITVNGTVTEQMDLTQFEKGLYFVSLENGAEKIIKKVVVQ